MSVAPSILVVDDEAGTRESLRMILRSDYHVRTVASGEEALRSLENEDFDLVTLDLKMPGLSGFETLTEMKRCRPDLDVVVITGFSSLGSVREALRQGASGFISKPFDIREIIALVRRCLERRRHKSPETLPPPRTP